MGIGTSQGQYSVWKARNTTWSRGLSTCIWSPWAIVEIRCFASLVDTDWYKVITYYLENVLYNTGCVDGTEYCTVQKYSVLRVCVKFSKFKTPRSNYFLIDFNDFDIMLPSLVLVLSISPFFSDFVAFSSSAFLFYPTHFSLLGGSY